MAADTITSGTTNANGELDQYLYLTYKDGADFLMPEKACAYMKSNVRSKVELDRYSYSANPFEAYAAGNPTFASGATKAMRALDPSECKRTVSGLYSPNSWIKEWEKYAPTGTLTNLRLNQNITRYTFELALNAAWTQEAKLFWQGNKASLDPTLVFQNGILKKIDANSDGDIVFIPSIGAVLKTNIVDILWSMYKAMPLKFRDDPDYKFHLSYNLFDLINEFDIDIKKTTYGVLGNAFKNIFINKRIVPYIGMPDTHIIGARTTGTEDSNFVYANYFGLDAEMQSIQAAKIDNLGTQWGYRVDFMADVQYRCGEDITAYVV